MDKDQLQQAIEILRKQLETEVKAKDIGASSMTPLKAIVVRETLLWRVVELADGGVLCLNAGNELGAVIFARAAIECAAVQHQLNRIIKAAKDGGPVEVDSAIMRLLMGTRTFSTGDPVKDAMLQMTNVQTCLKSLDKQYAGIAQQYEDLCEYAHPNWAGTAGLFSTGDATAGVKELGRYKNGMQLHLTEKAVDSITSSLLIFAGDYADVVDSLPEFFEACDRPEGGSKE